MNAPRPSVMAARAPGASDRDAELERIRCERDHFRDTAIALDDQVWQMRALLQSGKGFSELLRTEPLLHAIMAVCRERYDVASSAVLLLDDLDPDRIYYRVRAHHGLPESYLDANGEREDLRLFRIPRDEGLLWQVLRQGDVFSVYDMAGEPRFRTAFARWGLDALGSDVWVPLLRGSDAIGLLVLGRRNDGTGIPETEYGFLQQIASVAATHIDSALKYEKNTRILDNLRTLYDINQQLANVHDFKQLAIDALRTAVVALKAQNANLMLYNPESERLEIKVVWGAIPEGTRDAINAGRLPTKGFAIGEGVAGRAVAERRLVRINDRRAIEQVGRNEVHCIMAAPLSHGVELIGVMTLTNKVQELDGRPVIDPLGRFHEDDEQLLKGLADQAGANLHKARLYDASITDRLTGLYNARHFDARFAEDMETARREGTPLALAILDIDHFKRFNDQYGHAVGDLVLRETAKAVAGVAANEPGCSVYRYGGEEICVLMLGRGASEAAVLAEKLRVAVGEREHACGGHALRITVSAGVAAFPAHGPNRAEVFEAADQALYRSKQGGRNRVTCAGVPAD